MGGYGHAFKVIWQIKNIPLKEAAFSLGIDERSLRDIENGKTALVTERFDQLLSYYKIDYKLIFELASGDAPLHNVVHEAKRDGIVVHQAGNSDALAEVHDKLSRIEHRLDNMEQQFRSILDIIAHLARKES